MASAASRRAASPSLWALGPWARSRVARLGLTLCWLLCAAGAVPEGMVRLGGGRFVMGADEREEGERRSRDDLEPQEVSVQEFYLDATAVTNEQMRRFRKESAYRTDAERYGWSFVLEIHATEAARRASNQTVKEAPHWLVVPGAWWRYPQGPGSSIRERLHYPAVHISYNDAKAYCRWAGKRLPTETEWEAAARRPHTGLGAPTKPYPWGDERPRNGSIWRLNLWQGDFPHSDAALDGYAGVAPADAYAPSEAGLYNMLGNVWEWTSTWFSKSSGQRVLRGGSYLDSADGAFNHKVTCATRMGNTEDSSADNMGFRCAKSVEGAPRLEPQTYRYSQAKRKRPPPGVGDPLKDGGQAAQEMVQAIAAERGAEGLQAWMDKMGMGLDVMNAADAQRKQEERRARLQREVERAEREEREAHSFDDLRDEDIDKSEL